MVPGRCSRKVEGVLLWVEFCLNHFSTANGVCPLKELIATLRQYYRSSTDSKTHMEHLEKDFQRLQTAGLKLKPAKCQLLLERAKYLGHNVKTECPLTRKRSSSYGTGSHQPGTKNYRHVQVLLVIISST